MQTHLSHSPLDHYLQEVLATISNNTCIKFEPVKIIALLKAKVMDLAGVIADYICYLTDLDFRSYTHKYCVDIGLHYLHATLCTEVQKKN